MQQPPSIVIEAAKRKKKKAQKKKKPKRKDPPSVQFTEAELDAFLSPDTLDQEMKKMASVNLLPSQVTADVIDAVRWQEQKADEIAKLKSEDALDEDFWLNDLAEDMITFGLSPANTEDEAEVILRNLDSALAEHEDSGTGPDARDYLLRLRRELEIIRDKL